MGFFLLLLLLTLASKLTRKMFGSEKKGENFVAKSSAIFTINRILRVLIKMDDIG
jgi:hypothetical protein